MTWNQETVWIRKWGGVAQGSVPEHIPLGMFEDALNYQLTESGGLAPRMGFDLLVNTSSPDGKGIRSIFVADMDGDVRLLAATSDHVYEINMGTKVWTSIYTISDKTAARMLFALINSSANPLVVFGNGSDPLQKWDGTTVTACLGAPAGRPVGFKNYLAVFQIPGKPGRVQFNTIPGDPDTWTTGGTELFVEMTGTVTSVYPFGGLMVFTQTRTELFSGDPNQVQGMSTLSNTIGCASHESVADCGGVVMWLSQAGVMGWDGGGAFPAANIGNPDDSANPDQVSSRIQIDIDRFDWPNAENSSGVYDSVKKEYLLSTWIQPTVGGTSYPRTYVYSLRLRAWHPWSLEATALGAMVDDVTRRPGIIGGTPDGYIRKQGYTRFQDEQSPSVYNPYDYWAKSGAHDLGDPNSQKVFRAVTIASTGTVYRTKITHTTVLAATIGEFSRTSGGRAMIDSPTRGFILGTSVLGDILVDAGIGYFEARAPIALRAKHFTFRFYNSGSDNTLTIAGMGISFVPSVKRAILVGED